MRDKHHIMFERSTYSSNKYAKELRNTQSLIPRIDRDVHIEIHRKCPPIPMLGTMALSRTLSYFNPTVDTIQSMERLQSALERATSGNHKLERDLAELAIHAIDLQKPYLRGECEET